MKLQYLETSNPGLTWMVKYYRVNPQLNRKKAFLSFDATKRKICNFPPPKETYQNLDEVWEVKIQGTAFSILYTIRRNTVYLIDIRDQRGFRNGKSLKHFNHELRKMHSDES